MSPCVALVVFGVVCLLLATMVIAGRMRGRHGIQAPAVSGHPMFERAYRVQMNTLEQAVMFLPAFWLAVQFGRDDLACVLGALWLLGRVGYVVTYLRNPASRALPFVLAMAAFGGLLLQAAWGIGWSLWLG